MPRTRPAVYVALTPHGFGHAARTLAILTILRQRWPEVRLILATTTPQWLLAANLPGEFTHRPVALDVGVVQTDGITQDLAQTRTALANLQAQRDTLITQEAALIRQEEVQLVFGDVPALAVAIAQAAGRPCWMASNFGWDFIYKDWGPEFEAVTAQMRMDYGQCNRLFRLPFHEEMTHFPRIEDVGLTAGRPRHSLREIRETWGLTVEPARTVLLAFGGLGLQGVPYARLAAYPDW
ncbi:MAG: glycosyl transferase, partial [Gloeomargaritaceae cyanobacterium C42_A2020_066]|nr:glycosyl transferase [Gloeomargaritaceae cyanobacterium C42_A2020_066]